MTTWACEWVELKARKMATPNLVSRDLEDHRMIMLCMFEKVIRSENIIKSQQQGEPDLSRQEKLDILSNLLERTPGSFLMRFGKLFDEKDLKYFDKHTDFEVRYRVKELMRLLQTNVKVKQRRNRRYKAIEELTTSGEYFSEEQMRERNPLLYEHYIGQYLSEEERDKIGLCAPGELSLSAHIVNKFEEDICATKLQQQLEIEKQQSGELEDTKALKNNVLTLSCDPVQAEERLMLRKEFLRVMHLQFLNGDDAEFDYSSVDNNEEYDVNDISGRDEEDSYFDSEEPSLFDEGIHYEEEMEVSDR